MRPITITEIHSHAIDIINALYISESDIRRKDSLQFLPDRLYGFFCKAVTAISLLFSSMKTVLSLDKKATA